MKLSCNHGFTLIEIIISIGIIIIITSLGLINFNALGNSSSTYSSSRDLLVSDIRLTANKALHRERFQGQEPTGWGVYFTNTTNSYTIFADVNNNQLYDNNEKFKTVDLNKEIKISWQNYTTGSLVFNSGDAKTYVNAVSIPATPTAHLKIDLLNQDNALVRTLTVTPLGTISY